MPSEVVSGAGGSRLIVPRPRPRLHRGSPAEALQAFEQARASYLGDYLTNPYEEWASSSRTALQDRWLNVLERLGAFYSEAGTWEAAIACYRELLAVDCYREDAYRLLMHCYAASGRPADVKQRLFRVNGAACLFVVSSK